MRKYIKLGFIISIILVFGLVFIIGIYIPSKEIYKKQYIAIDDTFYRPNSGSGENSFGDLTYISVKARGNDFSGLFKFSLTDKPKEWNKLEFSFRVKSGWAFIQIQIRLLYGNWNESMTTKEIRDNLRYPNPDWQTAYLITGINGSRILHEEFTAKVDIIYLLKWADEDITKCLNNYDSITIEFSPEDYATLDIYSKESGVERAWLPQLIWS